jgi:hypothetical protein
MSQAKGAKVTSNLKLAAWRPYPLLLMDMDVLLFSIGGGVGMEKMKRKEARKNENIGKSLDSFFSFWLVFNRLHFSWFFIVFMIPVYSFLSSSRGGQ